MIDYTKDGYSKAAATGVSRLAALDAENLDFAGRFALDMTGVEFSPSAQQALVVAVTHLADALEAVRDDATVSEEQENLTLALSLLETGLRNFVSFSKGVAQENTRLRAEVVRLASEPRNDHTQALQEALQVLRSPGTFADIVYQTRLILTQALDGYQVAH